MDTTDNHNHNNTSSMRCNHNHNRNHALVISSNPAHPPSRKRINGEITLIPHLHVVELALKKAGSSL